MSVQTISWVMSIYIWMQFHQNSWSDAFLQTGSKAMMRNCVVDYQYVFNGFIYFWSSEIQYCGILKVADMHATGPWHYDQRRRSTEYNKIHWTDVRLTHWDLERECICLVTKYFRTKQQANSCTFSKIQTRNLPTLLHVVWLESLEHTNFIFKSDSEWSFWS